MSVADLAAYAPVFGLSGARRLRGNPELLDSVRILCQLAEDLGGQVQCRIAGCELEVVSMKVRHPSTEVRFQSGACRPRFTTVEHREIGDAYGRAALRGATPNPLPASDDRCMTSSACAATSSMRGNVPCR
jgi:hypothetical protein